MSSFSEAKTNNFIITSGEALVEYNKRQLSRIYPAGSRTTSSNFNPIDYWNVGCQIGEHKNCFTYQSRCDARSTNLLVNLVICI